MSRDELYHHLEWTEDRIARFWDFAACWNAWQGEYFSRQVGAGIVNCLRHLTPLRGRILDYGCGPGYLVEQLLRAGIACEAVDSSVESVQTVNRRFSGHSLWGGAQLTTERSLPFSDSVFDVVLCIETIEHMLPDQRDSILSELRRVMKPHSGRLFITTPNSEDLAQSSVYCPECGSVFHRYQHMASFSVAGLIALTTDLDLTTVLCDTTDFGRFQQHDGVSVLDWNLRLLGHHALRLGTRVLDAVGLARTPAGGYEFHRRLGNGPHLFWLGCKE